MAWHTTKKDLLREVRKHGASIEECDDGTWNIDAPAGKVWAGEDLHCLVVQSPYHGGFVTYADLYRDAIERMQAGLADCTDDECDICQEGGDA